MALRMIRKAYNVSPSEALWSSLRSHDVWFAPDIAYALENALIPQAANG